MSGDAVLDAMVAAARAGGAVALAHFHRGVAVTLKADRSPVSVADREAEQTVAAVLARASTGPAASAGSATSWATPGSRPVGSTWRSA